METKASILILILMNERKVTEKQTKQTQTKTKQKY